MMLRRIIVHVLSLQTLYHWDVKYVFLYYVNMSMLYTVFYCVFSVATMKISLKNI